MASWKTTLLLLTLFLLSLFLELLLAEATIINSIDGGMNKGCIEVERKALLEFKNGLKDPSGWLSSWVGADCCKWKGVDCNNQTGHVVKVDLKSGGLGGEISDSLLDLKHLNYLDLSLNDFQGIPIPISWAHLKGGDYPMRVSNLNWLSGLSSLKYLDLDLSHNNIGSEGIELVNGLSACANSSLEELNLAGNQVSEFSLLVSPKNQSLPFHLRPEWIPPFSLESIEPSAIDLSKNKLSGGIPSWMCSKSSLRWLILGDKQSFWGTLSKLTKLHRVYALDLGNNRFRVRYPNGLEKECHHWAAASTGQYVDRRYS
ncbi:leucine-rich repeat receptor-like protein kinase [Vitis vinifera]|uniref:Leucine-rich repeat receptor-like protein kinase n=1 Tax=Vitis vinifera TaxID=29760 RepID=A0A438I2B6_VITVI|nr:leucine-rich repeat receptor-like protein kinase [Vitis vinifera]